MALIALLVFYAKLGWAPGPGRQSVVYDGMVPQVTGLLLVDAVLAGDWDAWRDALAQLARGRIACRRDAQHHREMAPRFVDAALPHQCRHAGVAQRVDAHDALHRHPPARVLHAFDAHRGDHPLEDDFSLVVLGRDP